MSNFAFGIDLGTSNTAISRVDLSTGVTESVEVLQRVSESEVAARPLLPSSLYLAGAHELPEGSLSLPWDTGRDFLVGEFARLQGARVPGRLVQSAKSWLAHHSADPTEALLPYEGAADVHKVSPVAASTRYLEHLRESWDSQHPEQPLGRCEVVLTVPASFDELARELTQSAFYHWLQSHGLSLEKPEGLELGDQVLVCDIGGGTTDFTLIALKEKGLERVAVGEHLLLGGDNFDIALAYLVEPRLGAKLDVLQWGVLRNECRRAKELLLGEDPPENAVITVPGSGSKLLGGALTTEVTRDEVEKLVLDGFFPPTEKTDPLKSDRRLGLKEWGLPYASDPAIPRHLASFLRRHAVDGEMKVPNKILFNGGACRPKAIRERFRSILGGWLGGEVQELDNPQGDLAVSLGAAHYAWLRQSGARRIGGGTARSYYLQLSGADGAAGRQAICVVPRNAEAGHPIELTEPVLQLTVERPVRFPLFSSATRPQDQAGAILDIPLATGEREESEFQALPALETVVPAGGNKAQEIPVLLSSEVTEVGTLSLGCQMVEGKRRFRLEFPLRGSSVIEAGAEFPTRVLQAAKATIVEAFRRKPTELGGSVEKKGEKHGLRPRSLLAALEQQLGLSRQNWSVPLLRTLWEGFMEVHSRRRVEQEYESSWLNGCGYCLRPGRGSGLDPWRMEKTSLALDTWLQFPKSEPVRMEYWILMRRMSAGLSAARQAELWRNLSAVIIPGRRHWKTRVPQQRSIAEDNELLRLAVSLEKIDLGEKARFGQTLINRFQDNREDFWRLARLGTREPFGAGPQFVLPPDVVWPWAERIMAAKWGDKQMAGLALAQMCRVTGDRLRDFPEEQVARVKNRLLRENQHDAVNLLEGAEARDNQTAAAMLGEALPVGLRL
jgi:molecular chaperone DnaK (HSP70)